MNFIFLYKLECVIHEENDFTENKLVKTGQSTIVEHHPPVGGPKKHQSKAPPFLPRGRFMDNTRIIYEN